MKIIKEGLFSKNGITMVCEHCEGIFVIEGRDDFVALPVKALDRRETFVEYSVVCPCCGAVKVLGIIDGPQEYIQPYKHLTHRDDWEERYKVSVESILSPKEAYA